MNPGDLVVCVDAEQGSNPPWARLVLGRVYTFLKVARVSNNTGLHIAEIRSPSGGSMMFHPSRFRPVSPKSSALFSSLLEPFNTKVDA